MPQQRVHFSKEDIGGEILPILTTGLYKDTLDTLREYIQNAIDADGNNIQISIDPDTVTIADDGQGMTFEQARKALRLGISEKNPNLNIGFRGIGIYSAFNLCKTLEIFTKHESSTETFRIFFDFDSIRRKLLVEQERRRIGQSPSLFLEALLEGSIFVEPSTEVTIRAHGTKCILSGLLPEAYQRINNRDEVVEYLQNTVPLPFSVDFRFGEELQDKFDAEDYRVVNLALKIGPVFEPVFRPYVDSIFSNGGKHQPAFFEIKDSRQEYGFAWVCINDARAVIKDTRLRGLLIKKFGFSISDRAYLEPYFARTVFNRRISGEIIIKHPQLIPNAARSDFENNATRQAFLAALPKLIAEVSQWANKIQQDDKAREVLDETMIRLTEINQRLTPLQRDRELMLALGIELADINRRIKPHIKTLKEIAASDFDVAQMLLNEANQFVKEALLTERKSSEKFEREIRKAVQRETLVSKRVRPATVVNNSKDLIGVLEAQGILLTDDIRRVLLYLDENILKPNLVAAAYTSALSDLRDFFEEGL